MNNIVIEYKQDPECSQQEMEVMLCRAVDIDHAKVIFANMEKFPPLTDKEQQLAEDRTTRVAAIKSYRERVGVGLQEAKEQVDLHLRELKKAGALAS